MGAERRQFLRVACRGAIAELFVQGASVGMHSVQDVSEGGLFVESPSPVLPLNTAIEVHIVDSRPPARSRAVVVQVVRPGEGRPSGYALKLDANSNDMVAAVASAARPKRPGAKPPGASTTPTTTPNATSLESARVLIALNHAGMRQALCTSLNAFNVPAVQSSTSDFADTLGAGLRVALIEMTTVDEGMQRMMALHAVAPKARALLSSRKLPDAAGRRQLQGAGADQLLLPPLEPFEILKVLFTKARGDLSRLSVR